MTAEAVPPQAAHGGDVNAVARALGVDPSGILDLSVSLHPDAPDVASLAKAHLDALGRYPEAAPATEALAGALGVGAERVLLTNGGAEAIALVCGDLGRAAVDVPCEFSLYARHLERVDPAGPRIRSNPHNPTGRLAGPGERAAVWDEAFYPLATGRWTRGDTGTVVVGSLTKVFGCPGLRAGYVVGDPDLIARLRSCQPRWALNGLAAALIPELVAGADLPGWAAANAQRRAALGARLPGVEPSDANYVLVAVPGGAAAARAALARHSVLVRDCTSFGLPGHVRISVPDEAGLRRLVQAWEQAGLTSADDEKTGRGRRGGGAGLRGALMVCGTGSDAGKSRLVTGLCRSLARRGVSVAPFKAQNMALNSFVTAEGAEIGRAQGAQALAAGIEAHVDMNPILLKPTGDRTSQVIVGGVPTGVLDAAGYHAAKPGLRPVVLAALERLRARHDVVILEGAGSPAEINLLDGDLVNLWLAHEAHVPAVLVGDIDRGGVFAALYGTVALLPADLAERIRAFVINKFRGDPALLTPGLAELEGRTGIPTLGVLPWQGGLDLDAEDSLALPPANTGTPGGLDVAVVRFPRISNFTDLDPLDREPEVDVRYVEHPEALGDPDLVVLPGTKATVADLEWLRSQGFPEPLSRCACVIGICGGYQMLGRTITDGAGVESGQERVEGLGFLEVDTDFGATKVVRRRRGTADGEAVDGYQIHHGRTRSERPWIAFDDGAGDGATSPDGRVYGTSLHGLFEADGFRARFLSGVARRRGRRFTPSALPFAAARAAQFDLLADLLEAHLDMAAIDKLIAEADR